jgi:hypothetical protein
LEDISPGAVLELGDVLAQGRIHHPAAIGTLQVGEVHSVFEVEQIIAVITPA